MLLNETMVLLSLKYSEEKTLKMLTVQTIWMVVLLLVVLVVVLVAAAAVVVKTVEAVMVNMSTIAF